MIYVRALIPLCWRANALCNSCSTLKQPAPLGLEEIQSVVTDDSTLLLEYSLGEERSYLWAVTATSFASYELPPRATIEAAARRCYELLTARNRFVKFETVDE